VRGAAWKTLALVVALGGCGSSKTEAGAGSGTVSGTIMGTAWTMVRSAYWIGTPAPPNVFVFLFESSTSCSSITNPNWDKVIGNEQLLEIELHQMTSKTFQVPGDAGIAYLRGSYNPSAEAGTVTVASIVPMTSLSGSFDARFAGERLQGTFEAAYCAAGVEP
jgi:hypothetical protein